MKKQDFKKDTDADLLKILAQKREEVRAFRFGATGALARDVRSLRANKKDIARILTELNARTRQTVS